MILFNILALIILSVALIKSADMVIIALRRLSTLTKTGVFALSAIVLALGTSLPELFVGITSALGGAPALSFGVIVGSNIANIALVTGLAAFIVGGVNVDKNFLKRDVFIAFIAGLLPLVLVMDGTLSRVDGLILLATYAAYASSFFKPRFEEVAKGFGQEGFVYRFLKKFNHVDSKKTREFGRLFVGIALMLTASDLIVRVSTGIAVQIGIPVFVVGLVLIAIGTSLPELVFSLRSLDKRNSQMFFGNILGSTIVNSTLVIGLVAIISPIIVEVPTKYFISGTTFIFVFLLYWIFIKSKLRLERWEAGVLLLLYFAFVLVEFI